MSKKALLLVALFVLVVFRVPAFAAEAASFGHTWRSYTEKEKGSFLIGIATAVQLTCEPLALVKGQDDKPSVDQNRYKDCFNEFAGIESSKVIGAMNAFYSEPKNMFIPLSGAYRISLMQIRGVKVDDLIVQARKYGDALKKKMEDEMKSKPGK